MTRAHLHYDFVENFPPQRPIIISMPIHRINPKLYAKRVFLKIQYFKNILKVCELQGRGGNEHICRVHVSRSWTIQIMLQMFSL